MLASFLKTTLSQESSGLYGVYFMVSRHYFRFYFVPSKSGPFALFSYFSPCCLYQISLCALAVAMMKIVRGLELHRFFQSAYLVLRQCPSTRSSFVQGTKTSHFSLFYDYAKVDLCLSGGVFSTKTKFLTVFICMIDCKNISI